jgi:hypothetical protein
MTRHVELLGVLCLFWGGLALVAGLSILVLALGALGVILSAEHPAAGSNVAATVTAVAFFLIAACAMFWGGAHVLTGRALRRHRHGARVAALMLAVLNMFFLPFGTALAIYAFWVLLADETRRMFTLASAASPASHPGP